MEALKLTVRVEVPPDQTETETFDTDKYIFVCGTKRVRRRIVRVKVFK